MLTVGGTMKVGEASPINESVLMRQRGSTWVFYALQLLLPALGWLVGVVIGVLARRHDTDFAMNCGGYGAIIGFVAYLLLARRFTVWRFRRKMAGRQLSLDWQQLLTLEEEGVTLENDGLKRIAEWRVVTDLFPTKNYWVFMVLAEPWYIPRRFFADAPAEKAFVAEALSRMAPKAQARSPAAVAFVAS